MEPLEETRSKEALKCQDPRCSTPDKTVWFCADCDSRLCDTCWGWQVAHLDGKKARDGLAHEKAAYEKVQLYKTILTPPTSFEDLEKLHASDEQTLWFGVSKEKNTLVLNDRGQYSSLMSAANEVKERTKYPQLVSFIGDTNAGKSTLINILIRRSQFQSQESLGSESDFPAPVAGSRAHEKNPTTGDVHLYADPSTFNTTVPMLYVDCEGLEGGTIEPSAVQFRKKANADSNDSKNPFKHMKMPPLWTKKHRVIKWADSDNKKTRDYVVKELYPRLLYTFSDALVFVLQNPKTFQSVMRMLIKWGSASLEKALNLPRLPHAIVVLNMTSVEVTDWDPKEATRSCLESIDAYNSLGEVPEFEELAQAWKKDADVDITSAHALLMKYYSSFEVVRIPDGKGRFTLLDQQAKTLHQVIGNKCAHSFKSKQEAHMPVTTDGLNKYLQAGFDHFSSTLEEPFNFIKAELETNPPAEDFADHMWELTLLLMQVNEAPTEQSVLQDLARIAAPCIVLDAEKRDGSVLDLYQAYVPFLEAVLGEFCNKYWRCTFRDKYDRQCNNSSVGHSKGHQTARGTIIGVGEHDYGTDIASFKRMWLRKIQDRVWALHETLKKSSPSREDVERRLEILRLDLSEAFHSLNPVILSQEPAESYVSHTTCLSCLMAIPVHGLPCGHVICTGCVELHGQYRSESLITMNSCPIHCSTPFPNNPWRIHFKPPYAGSRVLSLDGGGVRGIIELEVLQKIEQKLGGKLPIRAFFDLVVGTSAGGIIALALAVKQWSLNQCTRTFLTVTEKALVKRVHQAMPEWMAIMAQQSIYKSRGLYQSLQDDLGTDSLFAGRRIEQPEFNIFTAVTAISDMGKGPAIITNYNRPYEQTEEYDLIRSPNSELDFKIWEAAAATSAAPKYFKAFIHGPTDRSFVDGGLYWNSPAIVAERERKLLWPDEADMEPDILLSIGTGYYQVDIEKARVLGEIEPLNTYLDGSVKSKPQKHTGRFRKTVRILAKRFDNILDTEMSWAAFKSQLSKSHKSWPQRSPLPYIRINIDLNQKPPKLDDLQQRGFIRHKARNVVDSPEMSAKIEQIANQLIASTFYFSKESVLNTTEESRYLTCTGSIKCRFESGSVHLKNLGEFLLGQKDLQFRVDEGGLEYSTVKFDIEETVLRDMMNLGVFYFPPLKFPIMNQMAKINLSLRLHGTSLTKADYPLSGFPRDLFLEDTRKRAARDSGLSAKPKLLARLSKNNVLSSMSSTSNGVASPSLLSLLQGPSNEDESLFSSSSASVGADDSVFAHLSISSSKASALDDSSESESAAEAKSI